MNLNFGLFVFSGVLVAQSMQRNALRRFVHLLAISSVSFVNLVEGKRTKQRILFGLESNRTCLVLLNASIVICAAGRAVCEYLCSRK